MSVTSPLIADWIENKLSWKYVYSPTVNPRTIAAHEMALYHKHVYPEGIFIGGTGAFSSPLCGFRLRADPDLDTERTLTIKYATGFGGTFPNVNTWASIPPTTPPGIYVGNIAKEWPWLNFLEISVFNNDTVEHHFIEGVYTLAVLSKPRPTPSLEIQQQILESQQKLLNLVKAGRGLT